MSRQRRKKSRLTATDLAMPDGSGRSSSSPVDSELLGGVLSDARGHGASTGLWRSKTDRHDLALGLAGGLVSDGIQAWSSVQTEREITKRVKHRARAHVRASEAHHTTARLALEERRSFGDRIERMTIAEPDAAVRLRLADALVAAQHDDSSGPWSER